MKDFKLHDVVAIFFAFLCYLFMVAGLGVLAFIGKLSTWTFSKLRK